MQPEEPRADIEPAAEEGPKAEDGTNGSEPATPPIDEDVAGSVNAAVPDTDE